MASTAISTPPALRHKAFRYETQIEWRGHKVAELSCGGKSPLWVSSPVEFKGDPGAWSAQDFFVGAANVCLLMTFVSIIDKRKIPVESYACEAQGLMEFVDHGYRFTHVVLRPRIVIRDIALLESVEQALTDAKRGCIVANSIRGTVSMEPAIDVAPPSQA
jgi:organic hydroperoxide reductase OsmC/OhrA